VLDLNALMSAGELPLAALRSAAIEGT